MKYQILSIVLLASVLCMSGVSFDRQDLSDDPEWGFYGHRKINRMAVFTLPQGMIRFYKKNIEYITEHAVDPDKRRYATKHEAVRHYIDIDSWGEQPFKEVPRIFEDALIKYGEFRLLDPNGDTIIAQQTYSSDSITFSIDGQEVAYVTDAFRQLFRAEVMPLYYEDQWLIASDTLSELMGPDLVRYDLEIIDHFSGEGILPYHMVRMYYRLIDAFKHQDASRILRISAEFGHYIGDAHVPLHTTKNYNGQLTDQIGIHAFWESRLPELFADEQYSFLVGRAEQITKPTTYFWNIVYRSHKLLEDVLESEMELRSIFPEDKQLCYDERLERTIRTQCPEFAEAYHRKLDGMVENRMQDAIHSIGSVWYSAWIEAGQPDLDNLQLVEYTPEPIVRNPDIQTRQHSN